MKVRCIKDYHYKRIKKGEILDDIRGRRGAKSWYNVIYKNGERICDFGSQAFYEHFEEVKENEMTKDDLKVNDVLVFENGERCMIVSVEVVKELSWFSGGGDPMEVIRPDLSTRYNGKLMKVYRPTHRGHFASFLKGRLPEQTVIWERQEKTPQQLKIEELEETIKQATKQIQELKEGK